MDTPQEKTIRPTHTHFKSQPPKTSDPQPTLARTPVETSRSHFLDSPISKNILWRIRRRTMRIRGAAQSDATRRRFVSVWRMSQSMFLEIGLSRKRLKTSKTRDVRVALRQTAQPSHPQAHKF
jgi:hypothetical protein